jgi:hypothetical protein
MSVKSIPKTTKKIPRGMLRIKKSPKNAKNKNKK